MIIERIPLVLRALLFTCRCDSHLRPISGRRKQSNRREIEVGLWRSVSGWLIVQVKTTRDCPQGVPLKISFGSGEAENEQRTQTLIHVTSREYQTIAFAGARVKSIRFLLDETQGGLSIESCMIYNVPKAYVRYFGFQALSAHHLQFRGTSASKIRSELLQNARRQGKKLDELLDIQIRDLIEPTDGVDYDTWIERVEQPGGDYSIAKNLPRPGTATYAPLISVLLVVSDAKETFLRECLDSVLTQTYAQWELCIVEFSTNSPSVRRLLREFQTREKRVRLSQKSEDGRIASALNSALEIAQGEYACTLDSGDALAPAALDLIVASLQDEPRASILYSDEDTIDEQGRRTAPHFKSDWNPDLLYCQNYVSRLVVFEARLLRSIGGFRQNFESQRDYDLLLRASAPIEEYQIRHIPHVLYHRRAQEEVGNRLNQSERDAWNEGVRLLQSFFDDNESGVQVEQGIAPFTYRPRWPIPNPFPLVSVVIPTRDNFELLKLCISSVLEKTHYPNYEVLVVDNGSQEDATVAYLDKIAADEKVRILKFPGKFNFSAINNYAAAEAGGDVICLLNDDTEIINPDWLNELVSHACRPEIGCVGAKLLYPDGRIQHAGVICGIGGIAGHSHRFFPGNEGGYFSRLLLIQNLSAVTAACLAVRREVWQAVGGMNETDLPVAFNDVDFCLRVRQSGLRNLWTPYALLRHHESASRGMDLAPHDKERYLQEIDYMRTKWSLHLQRDPYYSPNLSRKREDFSLSIPRSYYLSSPGDKAVRAQSERSGTGSSERNLSEHPNQN